MRAPPTGLEMAAQRDDPHHQQRRRVIGQRSALSDAALARAAAALAAHLSATHVFQRAERVSAYWPVRGEMDLHPTIETALAQGKRVYLPVLAPAGYGDTGLLFAPYTAATPIVRDRYGIPTPDVAAAACIRADALDLALVPLVLFDETGQRVGMGGGYYDRTFAFTRERAAETRPTLAGVAHEFQRSDAIEAQPWDVAMDLIVTDAGVRYASHSPV